MCPELLNLPARGLQLTPLLAIALPIPAELVSPERTVSPWEREGTNCAPVPEAPVDEYCDAEARENNVRSDTLHTDIGAVAPHTGTPEVPPERELGAGVTAAIGHHHCPRRQGSRGWIPGVGRSEWSD